MAKWGEPYLKPSLRLIHKYCGDRTMTDQAFELIIKGECDQIKSCRQTWIDPRSRCAPDLTPSRTGETTTIGNNGIG